MSLEILDSSKLDTIGRGSDNPFQIVKHKGCKKKKKLLGRLNKVFLDLGLINSWKWLISPYSQEEEKLGGMEKRKGGTLRRVARSARIISQKACQVSLQLYSTIHLSLPYPTSGFSTFLPQEAQIKQFQHIPISDNNKKCMLVGGLGVQRL